MTEAKVKVLLPLLLTAVLTLGACGTDAPAAAGAAPGFSGVLHTEWLLTEVRSDSRPVVLDRGRLTAMGFGEIFTLRFDGERAFGTAMPNSFNGSYSLGADREITFGTMMVSLMAALIELEEITEGEYISYLYNAFAWNLADGNLELHTTDEDGTVAVLVFVLSE